MSTPTVAELQRTLDHAQRSATVALERARKAEAELADRTHGVVRISEDGQEIVTANGAAVRAELCKLRGRITELEAEQAEEQHARVRAENEVQRLERRMSEASELKAPPKRAAKPARTRTTRTKKR